MNYSNINSAGETSPAFFAATGIVCRELDRVQVKGKSADIRIYDVLPRAQIHPNVSDFIARYQAARQTFKQQDLPSSIEQLLSLHRDWPQDGPTRVLLTRYRLFAANRDAYESGQDGSVFIANEK